MTPEERESLVELVFIMFIQACYEQIPAKFNHHYVSAYEEAQEFLIKEGKVQPEQCQYRSGSASEDGIRHE